MQMQLCCSTVALLLAVRCRVVTRRVRREGVGVGLSGWMGYLSVGLSRGGARSMCCWARLGVK